MSQAGGRRRHGRGGARNSGRRGREDETGGGVRTPGRRSPRGGRPPGQRDGSPGRKLPRGQGRDARGGKEAESREHTVRHGLARWISKFGLMSRTEAERCVAAGRVHLNGKVMLDPDRASHPERDEILLDGRPLKPARRVYLAMNKPRGYITTARDPEGRRTVYDLLPAHIGRVQAVGRLDAETTGLLLFTNDTEVAARITDGKGTVEKVYVARLKGKLEPGHRLQFERGVELDGVLTRPARCKVLESSDDSTMVEITIVEGRNRQIRRMWDLLGYATLALERIRIGPISLGSLGVGSTRPVSEFERATLLVDPESLR